eukprot:TRINITY_DN2903_c0_g1_i1.p3 TRINITY_DN2903_c0_g1~~TRINITY_DN2903_c0_g1_i1.p3  ORF type:complete len:119 (-),score=23.35 TRINITY_DN2903_c0_g1_i1:127-483(-)
MEFWQATNSFAIQDDYIYWRDKDFLPDSGKLMLIDRADGGVHQIFFDDNIDSDPEFSIVDIRDLKSGKNISYEEAINTYMVQVDTIKAILDDDYFIKKVRECEKNQMKKYLELTKGKL